MNSRRGTIFNCGKVVKLPNKSGVLLVSVPVIAYVAFIYLNPSTEQALALFKFPLSDLPSHQPHFLFLKKL
jgi:hypothetical protein